MNVYKTVFAEGEAEQIIERSKFIASVKPALTRAEAESFIADIRLKHREATHNVPVMVIGDKFQLQWASDDGEPAGTAGPPILRMLVSEGLTNICVVVTRYFGGVKLGTGGLVRAYTGSAKLGLGAAGVCQVKEILILRIRLDYTYLAKIQKFSSEAGFEIRGTSYEDKVTVDIATEPENAALVKERISDISAGSCRVISEVPELMKIVPQ